MYLFQDQFRDNKNNWKTHKAGVSLEPGRGLRLTAQDGDSVEVHNSFTLGSSAYKINILFEMVQSGSSSTMGLIWNRKASGSHYEFKISANGQMTVLKKSRTSLDILQEWKVCRSINKIGMNDLKLTKKEGKEVLSINGSEVFEIAVADGTNKFGVICSAAEILVHSISVENLMQAAPPESKKQTSEIDAVVESSEAEKNVLEMDAFVGLEGVKRRFKELALFLEVQTKREELGLPVSSIGSNMVFIGPPGTGKSSVAQSIGKEFKQMGRLPIGHVVEVNRSHIVAEFRGQSSLKLVEAIEEAEGGVFVFNDISDMNEEAAKEVISTFEKQVDAKSENTVFILTGHSSQLEKFLDQHSSLRTRFNYFFEFEHYKADELAMIFNLMCRQEEYEVTEEAHGVLLQNFVEICERKDSSFTNGKYAREVFEVAIKNQALRLSEVSEVDKSQIVTIEKSDIPKEILVKSRSSHASASGESVESFDSAMGEIDGLIGMSDLKDELLSFANYIKVQKHLKKYGESDKPFAYHMAFMGPPGTGKTTVARLVGRVFYQLGILSKGHVVETDRSGLVANFIGQSATKTDEKIQEAMGGILFIDEAYALKPPGPWSNDFGNEVIQTLLKRMEDHRENLVIIAAGYETEMNRFLDANPGLRSRFSRYLSFPDYKPSELVQILEKFANDSTYLLSPSARTAARDHLQKVYYGKEKNFGNGRYVRKLFEKACEMQANRVVALDDFSEKMVRTIEAEDIPVDVLLGEDSNVSYSFNESLYL